jgi:hypothetical protein
VQRIFTADPFGNRIELIQEAHASVPGDAQVNQSVTFSLVPEDLYRQERYKTSHIDAIGLKRKAGRSEIVFAAATVIPVMGFLIMAPDWLDKYCYAAVGGAMIATIIEVVRFRYIRARMIREQAKVETCTVNLKHSGLTFDSGSWYGTLAWKEVKQVVQTPQDIYVGVNDIGDLLSIPKRTFSSQREAEQFYAFARDHLSGGWTCAKCQYDLRGNQTGRCPECGELA